MEKNEKLNNLFSDWVTLPNHDKNGFIKDGIIDEEQYEKAKKKILFFCKEANKAGTDEVKAATNWDYREWWKVEVKYIFSRRIAEWSHGILNNFPPYDSIDRSQEKLMKYLSEIAFININKMGGGSNAEYERILNSITNTKNKELIENQINIINPDIIILGFSWKSIRDTFFGDKNWLETGYGIDYKWCRNILVIDFYHPSSRNAGPPIYCLLEKVFKTIKFDNSN